VTPGRILRRVRAELRLSGLAAWRGLVELVNSNDLTHAAAIAYYALLSFFPFLLLVISLLGSVTADEKDRIAVLTFVFRYFPTQLDFVTTQLDAFRQTRTQIGVAGGLGLIWASLGVFGAVTSAVNEAWGVEKQRSFWKHRMVSFLMLVAAGSVTMARCTIPFHGSITWDANSTSEPRVAADPTRAGVTRCCHSGSSRQRTASAIGAATRQT